jgi:hypothetical protein
VRAYVCVRLSVRLDVVRGPPPSIARYHLPYGLALWIQFFILYNNFIPISLYVVSEMISLFHALVFSFDEAMIDPETGIGGNCRATQLTQELGLVEYVFSDKTGTLTKNKMTFKACVAGDVVYYVQTGQRARLPQENDAAHNMPPSATSSSGSSDATSSGSGSGGSSSSGGGGGGGGGGSGNSSSNSGGSGGDSAKGLVGRKSSPDRTRAKRPHSAGAAGSTSDKKSQLASLTGADRSASGSGVPGANSIAGGADSTSGGGGGDGGGGQSGCGGEEMLRAAPGFVVRNFGQARTDSMVGLALRQQMGGIQRKMQRQLQQQCADNQASGADNTPLAPNKQRRRTIAVVPAAADDRPAGVVVVVPEPAASGTKAAASVGVGVGEGGGALSPAPKQEEQVRTQKQNMRDLLLMMSLVHTVAVEKESAHDETEASARSGATGGATGTSGGISSCNETATGSALLSADGEAEGSAAEPRYQAESPDELALVRAAAEAGYQFLSRTRTEVTIQVPFDDAVEADSDDGSVEEVYSILAANAFTSTRKRQSLVMRRPDGCVYVRAVLLSGRTWGRTAVCLGARVGHGVHTTLCLRTHAPLPPRALVVPLLVLLPLVLPPPLVLLLVILLLLVVVLLLRVLFLLLRVLLLLLVLVLLLLLLPPSLLFSRVNQRR